MGGVLNGANNLVHGLTGIDVTGGVAAKEGLAAQRRAASSANAMQWEMFQQQRRDQQPWQQGGGMALRDLLGGFGYDLPQQHQQLNERDAARLQELRGLSEQNNFGVARGRGPFGQISADKRGGALRSEYESLLGRQNAYEEEQRQRAQRSTQMGDFNRDFTMADFQKDPGYEFRMAEGQKALERSAAARGGLNSGATLKALTRFGQDYGTQEYQNAYNRFNSDRDRRFNRLSSIAGLGQTANSQVGAAGQNYANQWGANTMGAANAQAAYGQQQQAMTGNLLGMGLGMYAGGWFGKK